MAEIKIEINNGVGLHARPAALFVKTIQDYEAEIRVKHGDQQVNGKSLTSILGLGVKPGMEITVEAIGQDEDQAIQAIEKLVNNNFNE